MASKSVNPATGETIKEFEDWSEEQVNEALEKADKTFKEWRKTDFSHRAELMRKAGQVLRDGREHYADLMVQEMGKVKKEALGEIEKCAKLCDYYAEHGEEFMSDQLIETDAHQSMVSYEPLGVVLAVMPWNFPYWQVFRFACPGLMAGNVGVLKHASNVSMCALAIEEIFQKAGFPQGCFQTLIIDVPMVEKVIRHPKVRAATLTGSEPAGRSVGKIAGSEIKRTVLELGGSDPFIVLADCDMEKAVETAVKSRMMNTGQSCIAAKRFIVVEEVYDEFLERFKVKMASLKMGEPTDSEADFGPMAREDLAEGLLKQVKSSVDAGARVVLGGDRPDRKGAYFNPTILADITKEMPAYHEEMFGPVASVFKAKDADDCVRIANDSDFGLGGSVWTKDIQKGLKLARRVESGAVYVNTMMHSDQRLPFGGIKNSGYGRELGILGMHEFVNQKAIMVEK